MAFSNSPVAEKDLGDGLWHRLQSHASHKQSSVSHVYCNIIEGTDPDLAICVLVRVLRSHPADSAGATITGTQGDL